MLDSRTVIESIRDGATITDVIEHISAWILEARTLADALDAAYFTNGLPEEKDKDIFFGKATRGFHTLEMSLAWIQGAVDTVGAELFTQEQSKSIRKGDTGS